MGEKEEEEEEKKKEEMRGKGRAGHLLIEPCGFLSVCFSFLLLYSPSLLLLIRISPPLSTPVARAKIFFFFPV